jgi:hypothetical protein
LTIVFSTTITSYMAYIEKTGGSTDRTISLINKGDRIEGFYIGCKDVNSDYGVAKLHIFQSGEEKVGVWGKTYLNTLLTADLLGLQCLIEMTGVIPPKKKGRRPAYAYKVLFDREKTIDMTHISIPTTSEIEVEDSTFDPDSFESPAKAKSSSNKR